MIVCVYLQLIFVCTLQKFISKNDPDTLFMIIKSDIPASNGIIHIVDKVFTFATIDTSDTVEVK